LNTSKFATQKSSKKKQDNLLTATHKFDPNAKANFLLAPVSALQ
jgi:hypothetical protein